MIRALICWSRNPRIGCLMKTDSTINKVLNYELKNQLITLQGEEVFPRNTYSVLSSIFQSSSAPSGCWMSMKSEHRNLQAPRHLRRHAAHDCGLQWLWIISLLYPPSWIPAHSLLDKVGVFPSPTYEQLFFTRLSKHNAFIPLQINIFNYI